VEKTLAIRASADARREKQEKCSSILQLLLAGYGVLI
jgi:hypothetical protein